MSTEVKVPDIGDFAEVEVIDVLVKNGDSIDQEAPLITLESDKAAMDIPAPQAGVIQKVHIKTGDKVSEGDLILTIEGAAGKTAEAAAPPPAAAPQEPSPTPQTKPAPAPAPAPAPIATEMEPSGTADKPVATQPVASTAAATPTGNTAGKPYASPTVRRLARELGADLKLISGTGSKQRITKDDVKQFIRSALNSGIATTSTTTAPAPVPEVDFGQFGATETEERSRIAMLTAQNMQHSVNTIPHVTQFNEADITELESFRKNQKEEAQERNVKLTLVSFLIKAVATALQQFPLFNSSLSEDGKSLVRKHYFHIGMAVDTPAGLVVPVIRDVDKKGIYQIARDVQDMSTMARERKLKKEQMQGGCFTVSSLGGLEGIQFTPIINPPEVAILGVSHGIMRPVYNKQNHGFEPRLMLPLALSYDHRVVNGVDGAKFNQYLSKLLGDVPRLML